MSWLSNSLKIAGDLLEKVDQTAAARLQENEDERTLYAAAEDEDDVLLREVSPLAREDSALGVISGSEDGGGSVDIQLEDEADEASAQAPSLASRDGHFGIGEAEPTLPRSPVSSESDHPNRRDAFSSPSKTKASRGPAEPSPSRVSPPRSNQLIELLEENKRLKAAVKELGTSLKRKENKLAILQKKLEETEKELELLELDSKRVIGKLTAQLEEVKASRSGDEQQFQETLKSKDAFLANLDLERQSLAERVEKLDADKIELLGQIETLQMEIGDIRSNKQMTSVEAEKVVGALQEEIRSLQDVMRAEREQQAVTVRELQLRARELENANLVQTQALGALQRELENARRSNPLVTAEKERLQASITSLEEQLRDAEKQLSVERALVSQLQAEASRKDKEHDAWRSSTEQAHYTMRKELEAAHAEIAQLNTLLSSAQETKRRPSEPELETKLKGITERLILKQEQLDKALSGQGILQARLQATETRLRMAEEKVKRLTEESTEYFDAEAGYRSVNRLNVLRPRRINVAPIVKNERVAKAVNFMDNWTLKTFNVLRANPTARLFFVFYLLVLHLWVLLIISFHTDHLQEEIELPEGLGDEGLEGAMPGRPD